MTHIRRPMLPCRSAMLLSFQMPSEMPKGLDVLRVASRNAEVVPSPSIGLKLKEKLKKPFQYVKSLESVQIDFRRVSSV